MSTVNQFIRDFVMILFSPKCSNGKCYELKRFNAKKSLTKLVNFEKEIMKFYH